MVLLNQDLVLGQKRAAYFLQFALLLLHLQQFLLQGHFGLRAFLTVAKGHQLGFDGGLLPLDGFQLGVVVSVKEIILIHMFCVTIAAVLADLGESIHVELPDEGVEIGVLEVLG